MAEHWSLIVQKDPDRDKFLNGSFISVNLKESANRLKKVVRSGLSDEELDCFNNIAEHRNRIMHFYHKDMAENAKENLLIEIAKEQVTAWYFLRKLFIKWKKIFETLSSNIYRIKHKLMKHREYLGIAYEKNKQKIEKLREEGSKIITCPYCEYESFVLEDEIEELQIGLCYVCEQNSTQSSIICPDCGNSVTFFDEARGECENCNNIFEPEDIVSLLTEDIPRDKEFLEEGLPAHCICCDGYETVIEYSGILLCLNCFEIFKEYEINQCDWCGHKYAGEVEISYLTGSPGCSGKAG